MEESPHLVIKAKRAGNWSTLKKSRTSRLNFSLVPRNIKSTVCSNGAGWFVGCHQPFLMIVFSVFFGRLAQVPSDDVPYPIFSYSALIAWTYFSTSLTASTNSLVAERSLISKVYFPRMILPITPVIAFLLDFVISFIILIFMMLFYHIYPTVNTIFLPFLLIIIMLTASWLGMFLAALNANYSYIGYTVPFLVQYWMFSSTVVYSVSILPAKYHMIYAINPMVGVIEGFRSALLGTVPFPTWMIFMSAGISILLFVVGALYFRRTERFLADVI